MDVARSQELRLRDRELLLALEFVRARLGVVSVRSLCPSGDVTTRRLAVRIAAAVVTGAGVVAHVHRAPLIRFGIVLAGQFLAAEVTHRQRALLFPAIDVTAVLVGARKALAARAHEMLATLGRDEVADMLFGHGVTFFWF